MAIYIVPKSVQRLWDEWNLRGAVLLSLWMQILLILLAGMRKRTSSRVIIGIVWLAYLMADWVAAFAIGLIINNQSSDCEKASVNGDVGAFWASFLLLHLGGPDSITAFSIEDNKLWIRHLLGLVAEVSMVLYVLFLAIPNTFWIPSILVFMAGTIKYAERSLALYLACFDNTIKKRWWVPERSHQDNQDFTEEIRNANKINEVKVGYQLYKTFITLAAGGLISGSYWRQFPLFEMKYPHYAFKIIEAELSFMYDEFFTKRGMLHRRRCLGYFLRVTCTVLIASSFLIFAIHKKPKTKIHTFDVGVTYTLLAGAVILDILALFMLICSDWMMAQVRNSKVLKVMHEIRNKIFVAPHWCERIYQHNAISYHYWFEEQLHRYDFACGRWLIKKSGIFENLWSPNIMYNNHTGEGLKEIIFCHIEEKGKQFRDLFGKFKNENIKEGRMQMHRRDGAIGDYIEKYNSKLKFVEWSLSDMVAYEDCICMWHFATDLLYQKEEGKGKRNDNDNDDGADDDENKPISDGKASNILSNYLFYLLKKKSELMPSTSSVYRLQGFLDELSTYLESYDGKRQKGKLLEDIENVDSHDSPSNPIAYAGITHEEESSNNPTIEDNETYMILPRAKMLVKELNNMEEDDMWEMTKKVWLDLLVYGAANSTPTAHVTQLSRGGELFTLVWLLLAHAGLVPQMMQTLSHGRSDPYAFFTPLHNDK